MLRKPGLDFETLVELYYQPVFTFALKLCGKLERALELTQHTFCLALNRDLNGEEANSLKGQLLTILFREFLKQERFNRKPASKELRTPSELFYKRDFSCSQIADYLGISMDAVLTRLSKGWEELNVALAPAAAPTRPSLIRSSKPERAFQMLPLAA
jgi:DNA-directed RNA polymerase specialized sigma24 family protein